MVSNIDLRFTAPPMLSLFLLVFNPSNETFLFPVLNIPATDHERSLLFRAVAMLFLAILTLFFLLTSLKIPLNVSLEVLPIHLRFGDFSGPLALSVLASLLLPTPRFCIAYFVCICISPWFHALINTLSGFCSWFFQLLQSIPTFVVVTARSTLRSQDTVEAEPSGTTFSVEEADPPPSEIVPV
ncbi:hypothetical protein AB3S75_024579 [Citrus x aurantiifolia]